MKVQVGGFRSILTNLKVRYIASLGVVALLVCASPLLVLSVLEDEEVYRKFIILTAELSDSSRALSQSTIEYAIHHGSNDSLEDAAEVQEKLNDLKTLSTIFSHDSLQLELPLNYQTDFYLKLKEIDSHLKPLIQSVQKVLDSESLINIPVKDLISPIVAENKKLYETIRSCSSVLETILSHRISHFKRIEWIFTIIILMVLILQGTFILLPAIRSVSQTLGDLLKSEKLLFKAKEEAVDALRIRSDFITKISHEIRNPLNAILGMGDLLKETTQDASQRRYTEILRRSGQSILHLINDFLEFSRLEAGKMELENISYSLADTVENALDIVSSRAEDKELELKLEYDWDLPQMIRGDPKRVQQILVNLLSNAIKFTARGDVNLSVQRFVDSNQINWLLLKIADTGMGIPRDRQQSIFEDFVQVDPSINRKFGGSGLGLAICRDLIQLMEGKITLQSEAGKGSTFSVFLPLETRESLSILDLFEELNLHSLKIAILRGRTSNTQSFRGLLKALDCEVQDIEFDDFKAELHQNLDLILIDYPYSSDYENKLKNIPKKTQIIWLCQLRDLHTVSTAFEKNPYFECIPKPLKLNQILDVLKEFRKREQRLSSVDYHSDVNVMNSPIKRGKLLIVEDSDDNRLVFKLYLANSSYDLTFAESGKQGVDEFMKARFDLVFMDIQMPEMDGFAATCAIREFERNKNYNATPIVALTAYGHKDEIQKCLKAGCTRHLTKPIQKNTLISTIEEYMTPSPQ